MRTSASEPRRATARLGVVIAAAVLAHVAAFAPAAWGDQYVLGAEDVVDVKVMGYDKLSATMTVSDDGTVVFPMIGRIKVDGLTVAQLETELTKRLSDGIVLEPQVIVTVKQYASKKVIVFGEARDSGLLPIRGNLTLIELIARVGSKESASGEIVILKKSPDGKRSRTTVSLEDLLADDAKSNIEVADGDIVLFKKGQTTRLGRAFVFGQVAKPGLIYVGNGMSLREVIMNSGGVSTGASGEIVVVRSWEDQPDTPTQDVMEAVAEETAVRKFEAQKGALTPRAEAPPPDQRPAADKKKDKKPAEGKAPPGQSKPAKSTRSAEDSPKEVTVIQSESYELKEIMLGRHKATIYAGDTVYLSSTAEGVYYIMGEAAKTGRFSHRRGMTVLEAIAEAGGFSKTSAPNRMVVVRRVGGKLEEIKAEMETELLPGDILRIPEAWF